MGFGLGIIWLTVYALKPSLGANPVHKMVQKQITNKSYLL